MTSRRSGCGAIPRDEVDARLAPRRSPPVSEGAEDRMRFGLGRRSDAPTIQVRFPSVVTLLCFQMFGRAVVCSYVDVVHDQLGLGGLLLVLSVTTTYYH